MTYKSTNKFYIDNKPLKDKLVALTSNQHYRPRKLGCRCYDNALIQPFKIYDGVFGGGVLTLDNEIVPNTGYHEYIHQPYPFSEKDVTCRDEIVLYIGCIYQCWGHLFTDCFSKLWFLNSQDYTKMRENGIKVVYITKDNKPLSPFVYDLFDIAGVNLRDFEHISKHTRFNAVYVPDNSFYLMINPYERMFTDEYLQLLASIRSKYISRKGNYPEKIYLSRTKLGQDKRDYGEISVERFMKQAGYTVVYPEHHSVDEQIDMMVHCKHLAATEGSISLNSLFCQPGTELLVIKKGAYTNGYQAAVADAANLNVTYVEANKSIYNSKTAPWVGPFFIYPNENLCKAVHAKSSSSLLCNSEWYRYKLDHNKFTCMLKRIINR